MALKIFSALSWKWNCAVEKRGEGRVVYREGNHEYTFPAFEENGQIVLVDVPSSQRVHLFFSWYPSHQDLPETARRQVVGRVVEQLTQDGSQVRMFERSEGGFEHHADLIEARHLAAEALDAAGYVLFRDFEAIHALEEDHGLEICGIEDWHAVQPILAAMQEAFPQWHHHKASRDEDGAGWSVAVSMFPMHAAHSEWNGDMSE